MCKRVKSTVGPRRAPQIAFRLIPTRSKYAQSIRMMILHRYSMCDIFLKVIHEKVGTNWNLAWTKSRFSLIFTNFHAFTLISYWISIDFHWFSRNVRKISIFFRLNFNSSQLFRESLWENMSHMLCRCKIPIWIDCAYLERMEINTNHINRQFCESHTKKPEFLMKTTKI